ncbi:MAG: hypothetical protein APR63_09820 [Desulfuromonas sp. SDB]|nr:MAG: hypothetical protein APR63_09820 [Desulfuromonas sp. SDB]
MAIVKPFKALRPPKQLAEKVASPPYDVLNSDEARELANDNPHSFLHIVKPEIDLDPSIDLYDQRVYDQARKNLDDFKQNQWLVQDEKECFYLYRQIMGDHEQIGLVAAASVDEYDKDLIKKHEHTRKVKEDDRTNHIMSLKANTGPVFLTYRAKQNLDQFIANFIENHQPENDFTSVDGIVHTLWKVCDENDVHKIQNMFDEIDLLYVADGHHRSAAASRAEKLLEQKNPHHTGEEHYNYFLTVIFPDNQMKIMDYNRVVTDLNNLSEKEFLDKIQQKFSLTELNPDDPEQMKPQQPNQFLMYLDHKFYRLDAKRGSWNPQDPVEALDVSILQNNLLHPILGIGNPREDQRIDFVGGIRGIKELVKLVDSGKFQVAFALYPVAIEQLMNIADTGNVMPPKSTWFEPKLRSGLFIHLLE